MFDPRDYLALTARSLAEFFDEATQRSAINRAYYAAFLVAREYVDQRGGTANPPRGRRWGSHERVIFSIGMVRHPAAKRIRRSLFDLKKLRTSADYDLGYTDAGNDVAKALQDAAEVIAWIDALP